MPADPPAATDLLTEFPVWVADALAAVLPGGKPPAPATVNRWVAAGARTPTGGRVKLEVVRVASRLATSVPAVRRFILAQQGGPVTTTAAGPVRSPAGRTRASEAAARQLERMGC